MFGKYRLTVVLNTLKIGKDKYYQHHLYILYDMLLCVLRRTNPL